jgi:hypothetical protein
VPNNRTSVRLLVARSASTQKLDIGERFRAAAVASKMNMGGFVVERAAAAGCAIVRKRGKNGTMPASRRERDEPL